MAPMPSNTRCNRMRNRMGSVILCAEYFIGANDYTRRLKF